MRKLMITSANGTIAHELADESLTLGRALENGIQLDDPSVSSRHAQLQLVGEEYQLQDLGSTNGTRVNGKAITSATILRPGDRIRFGKVEACFECPNPASAQPLPASVEVEAKPAEVSERPADFANASPFPNRKTQNDRTQTALFAAAAVAILAFIASMLALAQMRPPSP